MTEPFVSLADDARLPSPAEAAARLAELTASGNVEADDDGNGGAVERLERKFAALLGKERAVMFPTGTLANLLAIRQIAGPSPARILVHRDSHFFNDSGDNLTAIGGYTMVPLTGEGAGFDAEAVRAEIARTASARVASRIGAIAVESPSRRLANRSFGAARIAAIAEVARESGIPLFLDGARMLIECAATGQSPAEMAAPFDIVYTSLYKYLDAPFGCVIAGPAALLDDLYHQRRRHGGSLWQMWPGAVMAEAALDRQPQLWADVLAHGEAVMRHLDSLGGLIVRRFADATNGVRVETVARLDPEALDAAGTALGLKFAPPSGSGVVLKMNETWPAAEPGALAARIAAALVPEVP